MKCCVCGSSDSEVTLFSFPKAEPYQTKWKNFAGIQEIGKYSRICQKHFREDEINTEMHRKRVKKHVVPSLSCELFDDILTNHFCMVCKTTAKRVHFKFPENLEKRNEWLKICGYATDFFNGDKLWYLCSRHFDQSVISKRGSAKSHARLQSNAVPTLFLETSVSNSESICNVKETVDDSVDYSLIPTKILSKISGGNPEILANASLVDPLAECTPSTSLTTAAVCSTINDEEQHSPLIINPGDILDISMELSDDCATEITSSTPPQPTAESSTPPQPTAEFSTPPQPTAEFSTPPQPTAESSTPSTYVINSIHDYTSPTTISKILLLHKNSKCAECEAFKHHIHTSLNDVSCSQVTPVPRKPVKRSLRYPGDISTPDFATPKRARRSVNFLKDQVTKYRKKVDILKKRNARLKKTIKKYDDLISHLKQKDMLSDSAYHTLSVSLII